MQRAAASLLAHRGHGPAHFDLVLGAGSRLPTLTLTPDRYGWAGRWNTPHRRRYLSWTGPLAGRGSVTRRWRGTARWSRRPGGWCICLDDGTTIAMRDARVRIDGDARWRRWHA